MAFLRPNLCPLSLFFKHRSEKKTGTVVCGPVEGGGFFRFGVVPGGHAGGSCRGKAGGSGAGRCGAPAPAPVTSRWHLFPVMRCFSQDRIKANAAAGLCFLRVWVGLPAGREVDTLVYPVWWVGRRQRTAVGTGSRLHSLAAPGGRQEPGSGRGPFKRRPLPPLLPESALPSAAAIMICLVLTIFANLFPAGKQRPGRGPGRVGTGCGRADARRRLAVPQPAPASMSAPSWP